jgi:beta-galactosidase GanA
MVFRGRNYTLNQYKQLFHSTAPIEIPLKGFQSCSKTTDTPFEFFGKSKAVPTGTLIADADYVKLVTDFDNYIVGKDLTNSLVDVMLKIKSKNGILRLGQQDGRFTTSWTTTSTTNSARSAFRGR